MVEKQNAGKMGLGGKAEVTEQKKRNFHAQMSETRKNIPEHKHVRLRWSDTCLLSKKGRKDSNVFGVGGEGV